VTLTGSLSCIVAKISQVSSEKILVLNLRKSLIYCVKSKNK